MFIRMVKKCVLLVIRRNRNCGYCTKKEPDAAIVPKSFDDIPGPKGLPIIGTLYKYLPFIGVYNFKRLHRNGFKNYRKYGSLVREDVVQGESVIWVFRPEDIAEVFKADTTYHPERRSHRALYKYRSERADVYKTGGLLLTNGDDWWRLRKEFQKDLSKPANVIVYIPDTDKSVARFVQMCEKNEFENTLHLLLRLSTGITCNVAFDLRIDTFSEEEMKPESMSSRLIDAASTTNSVILKLDRSVLWRFIETPAYRKLCKAQEYVEGVIIKMLTEKMQKLKDGQRNENPSLLEIYLSKPSLDYRDVIAMASDMFLAGIDTTSYSSSFALYHLARNPDKQEKLYEEAARLLPNKNDSVTAETLREASYTKAVIKETFRLNPISIGVGRVLQTDLVLNGYNVRKGTNVVPQNQVSCRLPEYFDNPDSFLPERWLRENSEKSQINPYLVLPFGHGPRACIARRLAEQNMQILLLKVCRNLKFDWTGGELDVLSTPINKPDGPIKITYHQRA